MPTSSDRRFQWLPKSLTGLAGMACAACCLIPVLLAAGVIGGAGWSAIARALPAVAVTLAAVGGLLWWWLTHRKSPGCPADCGCSDHPVEVVAVSPIKT